MSDHDAQVSPKECQALQNTCQTKLREDLAGFHGILDRAMKSLYEAMSAERLARENSRRDQADLLAHDLTTREEIYNRIFMKLDSTSKMTATMRAHIGDKKAHPELPARPCEAFVYHVKKHEEKDTWIKRFAISTGVLLGLEVLFAVLIGLAWMGAFGPKNMAPMPVGVERGK